VLNQTTKTVATVILNSCDEATAPTDNGHITYII
jgi:hypothetical protein